MLNLAVRNTSKLIREKSKSDNVRLGRLFTKKDNARLMAGMLRLDPTKTVYTILDPGANVGEMRKVIEESPKSECYPVLDNDGKLQGIIHLEQITPVLLDSLFAQTMLVFDLMESPRWTLCEDDDLARAMNLLERSGQSHLPVKNIHGKFMGFVSGTDIFKLYRGLVREADSY